MDSKRTPKQTARRSRLRVCESDDDLLKSARRSGSAVSLHCHTRYSREVLDFIPQHAARLPVIRQIFRAEVKRYTARHGRPPDFTRAWWTPPLTPRTVFESETEQIEQRLGLQALVSITDHDDIKAGSLLQVLDLPQPVPVSLEWTVPYGIGYFHLGIHNLPADKAADLTQTLLAYTRHPQSNELAELLLLLNALPGVLIVLNHPFWDLEFIGQERHEAALKSFLREYGCWLHAFEINGFRFWHENEATLRMARELGFPIISGGDRHGCQPNTTLNLTRATDFAEFVNEVREGSSEVTLLPEYSEPMAARMLEAAAEILRDYPGYPVGQRLWTDRVFHPDENGVARSLSEVWQCGAPLLVRSAVWLVCLLGSPRFRPALRLALSGEEATP
jgi:hypothetical protein